MIFKIEETVWPVSDTLTGVEHYIMYYVLACRHIKAQSMQPRGL